MAHAACKHRKFKILLISAIINIPRNIYYFRWQIGSISGSSPARTPHTHTNTHRDSYVIFDSNSSERRNLTVEIRSHILNVLFFFSDLFFLCALAVRFHFNDAVVLFFAAFSLRALRSEESECTHTYTHASARAIETRKRRSKLKDF